MQNVSNAGSSDEETKEIMTSRKNSCLESVGKILNLFERVKEINSFYLNNEQAIQKIANSFVASSNQYYYLPDYREKHISLKNKLSEIIETLNLIGNDIKTSEKLISEKFHTFLTKKSDQIMAITSDYHIEKCTSVLGEQHRATITKYSCSHDVPVDEETQIALGTLHILLVNIYRFMDQLNGHIESMKFITTFMETQKNIVMIGPNGCGKSTLARKMSRLCKLGATIIQAQQIFIYEPDRETVLKNSDQQIQQYQKSEKSGTNWNIQSAYNEIQNFHLLVEHLISEHGKQAIKEREEGNAKTPTILEQIMDIWKQVIVHRQLKYDRDLKALLAFVPEQEKQSYPFMHLSDGEKAAFNYIARVMLAEKNSYVIVDEPESHLNLAVVNLLWDELERQRKDCQFIYLTHNADFVAERKEHAILLINNMPSNAPGEFTYQEIPSIEEIGTRFVAKLVGSRRKILFCEGGKDKLDCEVYSALFPELTVMPVGSCKNVINCTRAYKKNPSIFKQSAIGIVDGDFRTDTQIKSLKEDSIYCLRLPEVENLLYDEDLLKHGSDRFCSPPGFAAVQDAKNKLFSLLEKKKEKQAALYVYYVTREKSKEEFPSKPQSKKDLEKLKGFQPVNADKVEEFYDKRLKDIQTTIKERNYKEALELYNCKSIMEVGRAIVDDYKNRIVAAMRDNEGLCDTLRKKYFKDLDSK